MTGGSFSSTPVGLNLNANTGVIQPSLSTAGTYTVNYTLNGCISSAPVTVSMMPSVFITYNDPYYTSDSAIKTPVINGQPNGVFTYQQLGANNGTLAINTINGSIQPSYSTAGIYAISYSLPASGGCPAIICIDTIQVVNDQLMKNVGVNISNPVRNLHINNIMRLEPRTTPPTNPAEGDIYYDGVLKKLRYYNGTSWKDL